MPRSRLNLALLGLCLASFALPIVLAGIPEALDYPNHLARIWLLGGGVDQGPMPGIYRLDWGALTNIGIDLLAVPLARMMPAENVAQLYLWLGAALPVAGMAALNARLFGGLSWWALGFGICAWNLTLLAGFLNFNMGLGLALLAVAADGRVARAGGPMAAFLLRVAIGFLLAIVHAFALFLWAAVLCGVALGPWLAPLLTRAGLRERLWPVLRIALPPVVALVLLVVLAPALPGAHQAHDRGLAGMLHDSLALLSDPGRKLRNGLAAVQTWRLKPDLLALALVLAPVGLAFALGRLRAHAGLLVVAACMVVLFLIFPDFVVGTGWLDRRFSQYALILVLVALRPELPPRFAPALAAGLALVVLVRTAYVGTIWHARGADLRSLARALEPVPPGAAILPLEHSSPAWMLPMGRNFMDGFPAYWHMATLAVPWRQAFVPTVFTARGKQPLSVRPPWDALAVPEGPLVSANALTDPVLREWYRETAPYVMQWRRFDYALILNADFPDQYGPITLPPEMELVRDEGFAQLWRIRHPTPSAAAP